MKPGYKYKLYGAILGDLCGQPYELGQSKGEEPPKTVVLHNPSSTFTDDTVMTLASAAFLLDRERKKGREFLTIEDRYRNFATIYQGVCCGKRFEEWLKTPWGTRGNSYGNGCLMRISPFMYVEDSLPLIMDSVMCSHAHDKSIAAATRLWENYQERRFNGYYDAEEEDNDSKFRVEADRTIEICSTIYFAHYTTHRSIIRAVTNGGDTDTNASILGEFSNFVNCDITKSDAEYVESKLNSDLLSILKEFNTIF